MWQRATLAWLLILAAFMAGGCTKPAGRTAPVGNQRMLVVATLTVQSSYKDNVEKPAGRVPDTIQWWITPDTMWRIKTFAIDHDIHIYSLEKSPGDAIQVATENTKKHYGDVLGDLHVIEIADVTDPAAIAAALSKAGLSNQLEASPQGFAFWNPDNAKYTTQSQPE
jgi:hypothetical protein